MTNENPLKQQQLNDISDKSEIQVKAKAEHKAKNKDKANTNTAKVIEEFKGSPDGVKVVIYEKDREVTRDELGDDLFEVAKIENWIK